MTAEVARVKVIRDRADRLPARLGAVARDWGADRRLAPDEPAAVVVGFAAAPATVDAMARAAEATLDVVGQRLRRWLAERTAPSAEETRAAELHGDYVAYCAEQRVLAIGLAPFARRLRALGIEGRLSSRERHSVFYLALRVEP